MKFKKKILLIARIRCIVSDMNNWNFIEICSKEAETIPYQSIEILTKSEQKGLWRTPLKMKHRYIKKK